MIPREQFVGALRTALMQLDDLQSLRQNLLLPLLCNDANPVIFQQILLDAIESLRSGNSSIPDRLCDILYYRYIEQQGQKNVAFQLGISVRQLRREQNNAIEFLADLLWRQLSIASSQAHLPIDEPPGQPGDDAIVHQELAWLRKGAESEISRVHLEVQKALEDAGIVAQHHRVTIRQNPFPDTVLAPVPPQVLRQALLIVLTATIAQLNRQVIEVSLHRSAEELHLLVGHASGSDEISLEASYRTASQLLAPFNGYVRLEPENPSRVVLGLPTMASVPILVLDDNPDARQLLQRYAANSRFRIIATDNASRAVELAQESEVRALVLDIMMPEGDGWDLLTRWRHHPVTQDIPVAVCTILPQKELSHLLGAAAFMQKPVDRESFLRTLELLTASQAKTTG